MLVTKNKLTEAIKAVLNYDNIYVDIQEREYDEEEIEIIALLILLHVEENGYFDRSEYDIDYRSISTLETDSIHSSKTTFKFYLNEDDFSNNELKSLAVREMPRVIKQHAYVRYDGNSWRKTNTAYYYLFDKLIDSRDFDSLIVGMF